MRVFVISDMEGIAGVTKWAETDGGEALHADRSRLYTEEINAAVRGAYTAGATEVVVMDCHGAGKGWTFNSLIPDRLDPAATSSSSRSGPSTPSFWSRAATPPCSWGCTRWRERRTA